MGVHVGSREDKERKEREGEHVSIGEPAGEHFECPGE